MTSSTTAGLTRQRLFRLLDVALFVWGVAAAANLVTDGIHQARQPASWPPGTESIYLLSVLVAGAAALAALAAKWRLRRLDAVLADEGTAAIHTRSMAAALIGALAVQLPYFFHVETTSAAQARFTVAAALVSYGAVRLWLGRDA